MSKTKKAKPEQLPAKPYEETKEELAAAKAVSDRTRQRTRGSAIRMTQDKATKVVTLGFEHEDPATAQVLAMYEIGTGDFRFYSGLLEQIAGLGAPGQQTCERASNFALSVIASIEPQDEIEAMLALQMATVHQATMVMARRLTRAETIPQQDSAERAFNKLARTYATQVETLKRHRSKGTQVVRVERVTVNEGGKAIVGSVNHGGGGDDEK